MTQTSKNVIVPEMMVKFRKEFPEFEGLSDDTLSDAARLLGTMVYSMASNPDAASAAVLGPQVIMLWFTNVALGAMIGPWSRAGVVNVEKAAALVAEIERKGSGPEGRQHAKDVAKGLWGGK